MSEQDVQDSAPAPELPESKDPPCEDCISESRRRFLTRLSVGLGALGAALVAIPSVAFLLGLRRPELLWRDVGNLTNFQIGSTVLVNFEDPSPLPWSGVTAKTAAWLRRVDETNFIAFSVDCTHLGCPVRWLASANLFMCPCHGGVFYANGTVASGPPPRPLSRYPVRVQTGRVQIQASPLPIT
ncbi:MAG: ubiquinol-cytochrome c reductase iron-sulfur subunit [Terriglobales bacterium]